jgi:Holliday junction resolvasome RuvABC endonuclease subunit
MKVGIDFSINSTAVALQDKDGGIQVFCFVPNYKKGKKSFRIHDELSNILQIESYEKLTCHEKEEEQSIKLKNAHNLSETIMSKLENIIPEEIRIEGYSFGSKGNAFIDLITFNTFLKVKLIQKFGHVLNVIPPKTLKKKFTNNGNASKCEMIHTFMKTNDFKILQEKIKELDFIKKNNEFTIPKPLDDVIDAIALILI